MARIGLRLLAGIALEDAFHEAAEVVQRTLRAELCQVMELEADGRLLLLAGVGWRPGVLRQVRVSAGMSSLSGFTLLQREPVVIEDLRRETRFSTSPHLRDHGVVSGISVIIHDQLRPFGVLSAFSRKPRRFSHDDVQFLQSIANLVAVARQRRRSEEQQQELLRQLQRAASGRDRAIGIVSHELRTPLSTIQMCATALLDPEPPAIDGIHHMANLIQRSSTWMSQIIQDLLDRTSLDAGRMTLERQPTVVSEVLTSAQAMFGPLSEEHSLEFHVDTGLGLPPVDADPQRLLQVLTKLLTNALRFTPAGGRIVLSAAPETGTNPGGRGVRFTVSDSGTGLPTTDLDELFDWLRQSRPGGESGAGLELSIARGLVEAHRQELHVDSSEGMGTSFWFTMPAAAPAAAR